MPSKARDIVFHVGDILHDDTLQDVGILIERYGGDEVVLTAGGRVDGVPVWRTWWVKAGEENYSEFGLQNLVHMGVFARYSVGEVPDLPVTLP